MLGGRPSLLGPNCTPAFGKDPSSHPVGLSATVFGHGPSTRVSHSCAALKYESRSVELNESSPERIDFGDGLTFTVTFPATRRDAVAET